MPGIYVRIHIGVDTPPIPIEIWLEAPNQSPHRMTQLDAEFIRKAQTDAAAGGMAYAGLISKIIAPTFPVVAPGKLRVIVEAGGERIEAATVTILEPTSPTA